MEYQLPKDLSDQFSISLKTVYNYLKRYPEKIRTKTEFWKTFVNLNDFTKILQEAWIIDAPSPAPTKEKAESWNDWKTSEADWTFQKEYNQLVQQNASLEKVKNNLTEQVNKYAILLSEEKSERKAISEKFERLQSAYNENIERFSSEKINRSKRVYLLTSISVFLLLVAFRLILPEVISFRIAQK